MKTINALLGFCLLVASTAAMAKDKKEKEGGIKVRLRKSIKRDYKDVIRAKFKYGPKQEYIKKTKQTHIWLPYGDDPSLYAICSGKFVDCNKENGQARFHSNDASSNGVLTYKITFDQAIGEFILKAGKLEYGLKKGTVVGVEYSTKGKSWKKIKEIEGVGDKDVQTVNCFAKDIKVDKLKTKTLYIRFYTRSKKEPEKHWGDARWLQIWQSGNPTWGDAERTFFNSQIQILVKKKY